MTNNPRNNHDSIEPPNTIIPASDTKNNNANIYITLPNQNIHVKLFYKETKNKRINKSLEESRKEKERKLNVSYFETLGFHSFSHYNATVVRAFSCKQKSPTSVQLVSDFHPQLCTSSDYYLMIY